MSHSNDIPPPQNIPSGITAQPAAKETPSPAGQTNHLNHQGHSPLNGTCLRIGVAHWHKNNVMVTGIAQALRYLGYETVNFQHNAPLPDGLDAVFVCGPFGSTTPLAKQLLACPPESRPALVYIMTEQLPNPSLPEWLRYGGGLLRSRLDRVAYRQQADGVWALRPWLKRPAASLQRYRYYGDLLWMQRQGILSVLALSSLWTIDFLRQRGFDPLYLPPSVLQGEDLQLERDIPVLWLGKTGSSRRGRILKRIRSELRARGVELTVIDGVENPYVFGKDRTILLNRSKIVLNIMREKWDDNSMRYILAAPCRALIVTEPTLPHSPFRPGIHLVATSLDQMADTICYYLEHDEERERITEQAYQLVTQYNGLDKMKMILERVMSVRQQQQAPEGAQ